MAEFIPGEVLTAANLNNAINGPSVNAQSTTAYTLVLADAGKLVTMSASANSTVTIPVEASVDFPVGTSVGVAALNTGAVQIVAASGVTLLSNGDTIGDQFGGAQLVKIDADEWFAVGGLS
jgi:predicted histidine transporter YuiF (NhaC family)